jgi:hypothetical protein
MSSISGLGVCIVLGFVAGALGRRILWCCMCNSTRWSSGNISIVSTSSGGVSTVVVNGKKYIFPRCNDISDVGGKIYLDGKLYDEKNSTDLEKDMMVANKIELHIHPIGDKQAPNITTSSNVVVHGNAGDVRSTDGDVEIGGTVTGCSNHMRCLHSSSRLTTLIRLRAKAPSKTPPTLLLPSSTSLLSRSSSLSIHSFLSSVPSGLLPPPLMGFVV